MARRHRPARDAVGRFVFLRSVHGFESVETDDGGELSEEATTNTS